MKKLIVIVLLLTALLGCSEKAVTTVCTYSTSERNNKVTLVSSKDVVNSETSEVIFYVSDPLEESWQILLDNQISATQGIKGYSFEYSYENGELYTRMHIDYKVANLSELANNGILDSASGDASYISLELTLEAIKKYGYQCSEQ